MTKHHAQLTWKLPDIEWVNPLNVATHMAERITLNSLPSELLLDIASRVKQADAVCLCLTTKKCFNALASKYLRITKIQAIKDVDILNALERDLPWNYYGACRPHVYPWSSPHEDASRILQNNIRVAKRRYLAGSLAQGDPTSGLSLCYRYQKLPLGFWGYLRVKLGPDGKLYLRCQNWLRWTDNMWKYTDNDQFYDVGFHDGFIGKRSCQHNHFDSIRCFRNRSCITPHKISPEPKVQPFPIPRVHPLATGQFQNSNQYLPRLWSSLPMFSCGRCETDVVIHFGLSPFPLDPGRNKPTQTEQQTSSAWTKRAALLTKFTSSVKIRSKPDTDHEKSPIPLDPNPQYWCDTMVITEWRCIGSPHLFNEVYQPPARAHQPPPDWAIPDFWTPRIKEPEYSQGDARRAFDGIPNQPYHPTQTKLDPLPLWTSDIPLDQEFEMPILMSQVGPAEPLHLPYRSVICTML